MNTLRYITVLICLMLMSGISAQEFSTAEEYIMPAIFNHGDSILLTSAADEQLFYNHTLKARQTLYSLSGYFGLDVFALYTYNPQLNYEIARVGDNIRIPIKPESMFTTERPAGKYAEVYYKVKAQDSPFAVRHRMLQMDKETFKRLNPQISGGLQPDELLLAGYLPLEGIEATETNTSTTLLSYVQEDMAKEFTFYTETELANKHGMAYWNSKNKEQTGFFVLFNDAPVNSYIEITNPMYNRVAYARVISNIPANMFQNNVLIVVSPMLANYLGVMDTRFFVKLRYLHQKEQ